MKAWHLYQTKTGGADVVHFPGCRYLKRNSENTKELIRSPADFLNGSYRFCQCCSPVAVMYRQEKKAAADYAGQHHQTLTARRGILAVSNGYSDWLIVPHRDPTIVSLYHKSTLAVLNDDSVIDGYHLQIPCMRSICAILKYVESHDAYRKKANAQKRAEQKRLKELVCDASNAFFGKDGRRKPKSRRYVPKKSGVIRADTSDWAAFRALFKPNAAT